MTFDITTTTLQRSDIFADDSDWKPDEHDMPKQWQKQHIPVTKYRPFADSASGLLPSALPLAQDARLLELISLISKPTCCIMYMIHLKISLDSIFFYPTLNKAIVAFSLWSVSLSCILQ